MDSLLRFPPKTKKAIAPPKPEKVTEKGGERGGGGGGFNTPSD